MLARRRPPAGPRGAVGADAEDSAADYLTSLGWAVVARNVHVGKDEIDIVALQPGRRRVVVFVEVRSRSAPGFGEAVESVDDRKVLRLYRAAMTLLRRGDRTLGIDDRRLSGWRIDLLTLRRGDSGDWVVDGHLRGLAPP